MSNGDDPLSEMRRAALGWLARREFSRHDLAQRLARKFPDEDGAPVLDWLESERFLDDRRFAEVYFRSRVERDHGPLRIRQDMRQRGLADALITDQFEQQSPDWFALAAGLRQRRFGPPPAPGDDKGRARQLRFLQYRGFTAEQCFHALSGADADA
ncbi:MAG: regulatory protein RecX [Alcanivoracaceae bacterium]|nr:regulatory protein RecX [Alcanivoracaceae bacterium]